MATFCDWPVDYGACTQSGPYWDLTDEERAPYEDMARDYLSRWTDPGLGACPVTVRPCRVDDGCHGSTYTGTLGGGPTGYQPVLVGGRWRSLWCSPCFRLGQACECDSTPSLTIPGPVFGIEEVRLDGVELSSDEYRLHGSDLHLLIPGAQWPTCQDVNLPDTEPGTFSITYRASPPVPFGGQIAAGILAREFYLAVCGSRECQLPKRVQQVSRQDVTVMFDSFDDLSDGRTGIWLIDSWLETMRRPPTRPIVKSPDYGFRSRPRWR